MRATLAAVAAAVAGAALTTASCMPDLPLTPKVLMIGIDGVRVDVLAEVATPNLDALAAAGTFSDRALTGQPTVSGPGWSSFLTGVWPEKHGVLGNDFTANRYDLYPDVLTRVETVRPELNTFVVADWLPLVTTDAGGPVIGDAPDVKVVLDGYELGWAAADERSVDAAVSEMTESDPDLLFVYLGNPDETSHRTGSIGDEYRAAIAEADRQVGRLLDAIQARPDVAGEDWLVLVSTDHGRTEEGGHGGDSAEERTIFFLASGRAVNVGVPEVPPAIVDVAVTALVHLGIELEPAWELDGRAVGLGR